MANPRPSACTSCASTILQESSFENIHIPPSPGDAGSAIGAAQYLYYSHHKQNRKLISDSTKRIIENVYVGPSYSIDEIESPLMPDRSQWLNNLAYCQWSISEIRRGLPWGRLRKYANET